jgi:hypothetical protein
MGKPKLSVLFLISSMIFVLSAQVFAQTDDNDKLNLDLKNIDLPSNPTDATMVYVEHPFVPELRELSWFDWYIVGNFNKVVDYFTGDKPDGSANDGKVLLTGLAMLPIGEAFQIGRAGKVAVQAVNERGVSKAAIVDAFKAAGVPKKYISAFKASFKGFLKMEQWDEIQNPVFATATTNVETGHIFVRYENLWWQGVDLKNFYNAMLEEAVHSYQVKNGLFVAEKLLWIEARAKIIAYKYFGNWPADKEIVEEQLKLYKQVFKLVLANVKK